MLDSLSTGVEVIASGGNIRKEALLILTLGKTKSSKPHLIRDGYVLFEFILQSAQETGLAVVLLNARWD